MKVFGERLIATCWILVLVSSCTPEAQAAAPHVGPYLQNPAPDAMTIMWESTEPCIGTVEYGRDGKLDKRATEPKPVKIHEIRLEGLEIFSEYTYRIKWDGNADGPYKFKTARPIGAKKFRIAMYGDSRTNPEVHRRCVEVMARHQPEIVLNSGDLVSQGSTYRQWKPQFFDPLSTLIREVPILTVLGNHEQNSSNYFDFYSLPGNESWYSIDYGNLHIIGLDSNIRLDEGSPQLNWLIEDLKKTTKEQWVLVFFHHPMFSAHPTRGVNINRWWWQPIFQEYGVDLAVAGHDHHYLRCHPIGDLADGGKRTVQHFTSGGGGAGLYPVYDWPWVAKAQSIHNVTMVDFDGDQLTLRAYSEHGDMIDETVIVKDAPIPPDRFVAYDAILWEREFRKQLASLEPIEMADGKIATDLEWKFPATFKTDIKINAIWNVADNWTFKTNATDFLLQPGKDKTITAHLEANWPDCYPTPTLKLAMTDPDGKKLFRNSELDLSPVRIWPKRDITAAAPPSPIVIDAEPDDWQGIPEVTSFVDATGTKLADQQTRVRVARDKGNFYLFAFIDMSNADNFGRGDETRDDDDVLEEDESFQLGLASDFRVYTFSVNTLNVQYDANRTDKKWDHKWESAVAKAATTWYVEMKIPLEGLDGDLDRVNFGHTDGETETRSEWVPTFGRPAVQKQFGYLKGG